MPELPEFIIYSSCWGGNHGAEFRFARDEKHVKNILRGLFSRYGADLDVGVFLIGERFDVTSRYVLSKESEQRTEPPF
ncbi:hypothetical protein [Streptomyces noursei]|uniref:hypothetical protein n=1 Tax=Streptomyces noursei TaxID=1971 RepID=UPI0016762557|nr:hypothetical protein [Streptomyces noursei]MCZ1019434.1 hypothetical protein [Streptomyces noursei]GGX08377.1 hypothetical protein GCM10010341_32600 [Streptomyces noursei]